MASERISSDEVDETWGYVDSVAVEQEDDHDQIHFTLKLYYTGYTPDDLGELKTKNWDFFIYLDIGTTVALAQLQLLRDAMVNTWLTKVHFQNKDYSDPIQVYLIRVYPNKTFPTTVNEL